MFSPGIRNPRRSLLICVAITLVACASIAWGVWDMQSARQETLASGLAIGLALLPAIMAPMLALNFWGAEKKFAAIRRGEGEIGRWRVSAAELAAFASADKARSAQGVDQINDWPPPRDTSPSGIEVIFVPDGVLVGDTYFSLVTTGLFRFSAVWLMPDPAPAIAFRTSTTYANRFNTRTMAGQLRIPVSGGAHAQAANVVTHFSRVAAGEVIANPDFYKTRVRIGLIGAPICFAIAAVGFILLAIFGSDQSGFDASILIIIGLVAGIAMLVLAGAAALLGRAQQRKHATNGSGGPAAQDSQSRR